MRETIFAIGFVEDIQDDAKPFHHL